MAQKFMEIVELTYVFSTPSRVSGDTVVDAFLTANWVFEIEQAISVSGKIKSVETPKLVSKGIDACKWEIKVELVITLEPWFYLEPGQYSRSDTMEFVSVEPSLPEDWEITQWIGP